MSLAIQRSSEFSASSVGFSKLRKNKNGGKTVYLNGGDNKKLYIQLPFMRSPFGLSAFTDEALDVRRTPSTSLLTRIIPKLWTFTIR